MPDAIVGKKTMREASINMRRRYGVAAVRRNARSRYGQTRRRASAAATRPITSC